MHAFLVVGEDSGLIEAEVEKIVSGRGARRMDLDLVKISEVRELKRVLSLALNEPTAIVSKDFSGASEEAQNAFLKLLEEPQAKVTFILTCRREGDLLATIESRCEVIRVDRSQVIGNSEENEERFEEFWEMNIVDRLKYVGEVKDREEAKEFLKNIVSAGHGKMIEKSEYAGVVERASEALSNIERNGNVQLQLVAFTVGFAE